LLLIPPHAEPALQQACTTEDAVNDNNSNTAGSATGSNAIALLATQCCARCPCCQQVVNWLVQAPLVCLELSPGCMATTCNHRGTPRKYTIQQSLPLHVPVDQGARHKGNFL
jgi:hypothetical protein